MEGLQVSDILIHIINMLVLFAALRLILFNPVNLFLMERTTRIESQLLDAKTMNMEALELKTVYEHHIETYEGEGLIIVRESQTKASAEASTIVEDARKQAEKLLADAHVKIANDKMQAIADARTEVALLATDIAARILKREVKAGDNKAVAEEFFREMR